MLACCIVTMKNGVITRLDEYLDPAQAAPLKAL
jgi:ketosteroid isomerase-like protein